MELNRSFKRVYLSPESFLDHVVLGDAVVGQSLVPVRIQSLVDRLCPQLIGLQPKIESEKNPENSPWYKTLTLAL